MATDLLAFTRALAPSLDHIVPPPARDATFSWQLRPPGGTVKARFYTDGSRLDGPTPLLARNGWAFVAVDEQGAVVAHARGVPPDWITCIPGSEAWALLQAAMVAEPGSDFRLDCKPCVDAIQRGMDWATSAARPLARVFSLLFPAIDDVPVSSFVWMPAHCKAGDVGTARLGNGALLTATDLEANARADASAKAAVEIHRVPSCVVIRLKAAASRVHTLALWLGRATFLANNQAGAQKRDSVATRRMPKRERRSTRGQRMPAARAPAVAPRVPKLLACLEPLRARLVARQSGASASSGPSGAS